MPLPALALLLLPQSARAETEITGFTILATLVIVLQIIIIIISQISRRKHKRGRLNLQMTQRELEQRVVERTESLKASNDQLTEAISQHQATEILLRETKEYLHSIINSMPSILIGVTDKGLITHWNSAAFHATNVPYAQALEKNLFEIYPDIPATLDMIRTTIDQGLPRLTENIQSSNGSDAKHVDLTIYPLVSADKPGAVIRIDDVTMRVRMENMMIQNEKMMSLGELAAGMAHEINNPLSAIINGIQNVQRRTSSELAKNHQVAKDLNLEMGQISAYLEQREVFKFLDNIREAGDRSARIVTNMLEFSRNNPRNHELVDLKELLEHALLLANNSFELKTDQGGVSLQLNREYEEHLPKLLCSATEIQQVILNLLRNACQCFEPQELNSGEFEPQITLRLYRWDDHVCLEIQDNGPGMQEEVRRHIFEPFYTTKDVGQGTGLGLSVSYFIVTEHHEGTIEVESSPDQGTNFIITLPLQVPLRSAYEARH